MKGTRSWLLSYGIAVLAVALTLLLKLLLDPLLETENPFLLFFAAVMVSAWYGGMRAGLLATGLAALSSDYFFLSPLYSFFNNSLGQNFRLGLFVIEGVLLSLLISALHSAKQQAEQHLETMRRNEKRYCLLVENEKDYAIFMLATEGRVTSWSLGAERILGYQEAEIVGQNGSRFFTPEDIQQGAPEQELSTAVAEGRAEDERWHVRKDGTRFFASGIVTPLRDEAGSLLGFCKMMRDFTDRKRTQEERDQLLAREQAARAEAEAANRMKDEFLAIVSHELRSPLNAILGWARLLRTRKFNEATTARAIETIERNAALQTQLIEDLLDISRLIRGKLRLQLRPVNLVPIIEAAIDTVRPAADAKTIQLEFVLDSSIGKVRSEERGVRSEIDPSPLTPHPSPLLVSGDSDRLQQIVWNLLSNAVKFTPEGGCVEVQLEHVDSYAQIRVSDTGKGISAEFLPYVFDRFRQADSTTTRSHGGLGLGLAIVRQLVELHGGTVGVESLGEGQGATFTVKLPLLKMREGEGEIGRGADRENFTSSPLNGLRVLVVEDQADMREYIVTVLEQCGAEVSAIASAAEALEALQQFRPHVLVSDIGMPEEDGYGFIGKVRKLEPERGGKIPAVALTAYAREEDRIRALSEGFQVHVPKPVDPAQLVAVLANLTGRNGKV